MQPYKIILLINGAATSGGDVTAELMKQVPNVTVVGDATNGAGCTNHPDDLIESDYFLPNLSLRIMNFSTT